METQLTTQQQESKPTTPPIVIEKRTNWANLGEFAHYRELELQVQAQDALKLIAKFPLTIADVPEAEQALKDIKKRKIAIVENRKPVTQRLEAISTRLMLPEKTLEDPILKYEQAIITIKKNHETNEANKKKKEDELIKCRESLLKHKNNAIEEFNKKISNTVELAYTHALGAGNITIEGKDAYLEKVLAKYTDKDFPITIPTKSFSLISNEEYNDLCKEILTITPITYVNSFVEKVKFKFSDFDVAVHNKAQALENSRLEKEAADKKALEEKQAADIAATLQSVAITPTVDTTPVKALKSNWAIDMEETLESSIVIMTAFVANISLIKPMLKVNKFNSLTVGQMATYLCKCKTADENFSFTGVKFKTIDKL